MPRGRGSHPNPRSSMPESTFTTYLTQPKGHSEMNSPRDLAAKLFDAYNAHRPDDVAALYAPVSAAR